MLGRDGDLNVVLLERGGARRVELCKGLGHSVRFDSFADNFGDWYFGLSGGVVFGN